MHSITPPHISVLINCSHVLILKECSNGMGTIESRFGVLQKDIV
jgi:hypothetical protein